MQVFATKSKSKAKQKKKKSKFTTKYQSKAFNHFDLSFTMKSHNEARKKNF